MTPQVESIPTPNSHVLTKVRRLLHGIRRVKRHIQRKDVAREVSPPVLVEPKRFPFGPFRFKVQNSSHVAYVILSSRDLQTWSSAGAQETKSQKEEFVDSEAPKFSYRFYRAEVAGACASNALGYASTTFPPGFSLVANPFHGGANTVSEMFASWPDGTTLNKFDTRLVRLTENAVHHGKWSNPGQRLMPGEGAIFFNPTNDYKMHTFVGEVAYGTFTVPVPSGFSLRSSLLPRAGDLVEQLNFPISTGDVVHLFDRDRQKYLLYSFENGRWLPSAPILGLGESFWIAKANAGNWSDTVRLC